MALNGSQLGDEIAQAARGVFSSIPTNTPVSDAQVDAIWQAIGPKIIDHIKNNAVVTVVVAGGSSSGSHTGTIS
ncbi:MAG: hypothetical protein GY710_24430 [Desulfobacteraceae bacterium]|nr:hypothetical protein [Desulfobacteraceae bacterium]